MISVNELIGQLLLQHNCVVIPGFGGFVASQSSAVVDFSTGTMSPPRKSLLFNKQLINNDGLLLTEFSNHNLVSYLDAQTEIQSVVETWNQVLRKGENIELPNVGRLFFDKENNIAFEQDRFFNLLLQSYGLNKIHFVAEEDVKIVEHKIQLEETIPVEKVVETITPEIKILPHPATQTKVWRYVAAACILPIAFYSVWIPVKTDVLESGLISIKDFNPFYKKGEAVYERQAYELKKLPTQEQTLPQQIENLPENTDVFSYRFDQDTYIPVKIERVVVAVEDEAPIEAAPPSPIELIAPAKNNEVKPAKISGSFSYIVGCFSNESNATKLVEKLRNGGLNASLAGNVGGLTRVSAGSANSQQEIQVIASKAQSLGFSGWILKK